MDKEHFYGWVEEGPLAEPPEPPTWLVAGWDERDQLDGMSPCTDVGELSLYRNRDGQWPADGLTAVLALGQQFEASDRIVDALRDLDACETKQAAARARLLAGLTRALGGSSDDPSLRADAPSVAASVVAAALKVSQRTARGQVAEALMLTAEEWQPVLDAMDAGVLPRRRVMTILDAAVPVPVARRRSFAEAAVEYACPEDPEHAPSQRALGRRLRRLVDEYADEPHEVRKKEAAARRRADLEPAPDGMCWLTAYLPLEVGAAIDTRLEALARSLQSPTETRGIGQLRADVLADLLAGTDTDGLGVSSGVRTELVVTVPATTLNGSSNAPGEIIGYGPVDAEAVTLLAADAATWTRLWVDPDTGAPVALGRRRYTPTLAMRRQLGLRDRVCRFPGCDRPAAATEADHTAEWADGGTTDLNNLELLCREHHRLKSLGYWTVRQLGGSAGSPDEPRTGEAATDGAATERAATDWAATPEHPPGTLEWTSPLGEKHVTYPESDPRPPF